MASAHTSSWLPALTQVAFWAQSAAVGRLRLSAGLEGPHMICVPSRTQRSPTPGAPASGGEKQSNACSSRESAGHPEAV
jgi:hypothetical protein